MRLTDYIWPDNAVAQSVVVVLLALFGIWLLLLLWSLARSVYYRGQIGRCQDVSSLVAASQEVVPTKSLGPDYARAGEESFEAFRAANNLKEKSPVERHLRAIFSAGWNESQLDVRALLKSTTDQLFRAHSLHRALLSVFIILGLLGTLFGLADSLSLLAEALSGGVGAQVANEKLNQGLQHLLGSLKGAFGPSILGVLLTVAGVVLFALYLRFVAAPLAGALERATLTAWVPRLMPTASQRLLDKLQLSERQMQRNFEAAQQVGKLAEGIEGKTGALGEALGQATESLGQMRHISGRLADFSENFVEAVKGLQPFQQELRALYQQMVEESRAFQESVRRNIAGSEEFQRHIQGQLDSQHQQMAEVLSALRSYESAYVAERGGIDAKLGEVLTQAQSAFQNLSRRNDEIARALDEALGRPLREVVTQRLSAVETTLGDRLGGVENTLNVQLGALSDRLRDIDRPLNTAADKFTDTFHNFNEYTGEWRAQLQREFAKQNETSQQQLRRLDALSEQVPKLLQQLSASSDNFTTGGQQLSQDIGALSQNVAALGQNVDALGRQVGAGGGDGGDGRTAELLGQQLSVLQQLSGALERLAAAQASRLRPSSSHDEPVKYTPPPPPPGLPTRAWRWLWRPR